MASKYDDLDPSTGLEQAIHADLRSALEGRGCVVIHNGTNSGGRHAPGGKADIEIRDPANERLILVEVTKRKSSSADGEFLAVTDHLDKAVKAGGYTDYAVLYVSPATSARLSSNFRDLWNRSREREGKRGRVVAIDFAAAEMVLTRLAAAPSEMYPASRWGRLFARWVEAADDSLARLLVQQTILPEDIGLGAELEQEVAEFAAGREKRLKSQLEEIENQLRDHGVVGDDANRTLVYLTFLRLYEERRQRLTGTPNRFTSQRFAQWCSEQPAILRNRHPDRMVEVLLREVAEDDDLHAAGLLRDSHDQPHGLHPKVRDGFVVEKLLPVFDEYDFNAGRVDILGAVFETLARRGEKDTRIGQFFTPQPVVDFCAGLVPLRARDVVLDPAVGTARFLIRAMGIMLDRVQDESEPRRKAEAAIRAERLIGTDIGSWVATIGKMNMYVHGDGKTNVREANGLVLGDRAFLPHFPNGLSGRVDVVLTNPPLGDTSHSVAVENWRALARPGDETDPLTLIERLGVIPTRIAEDQKLAVAEAALRSSEERIEQLEALLPDEDAKKALTRARGARKRQAARVIALKTAISSGSVAREPVNRSMKGGALFLGAIADYLKLVRDQDARPEWRGGWAAVVVDEAILNTPDYGPTREFIRDRFYVKAVVSLGRQAFKYLAHTDAKTSVLLLVRKPEPGKVQTEPTFYAHAEQVGYGPTGDWVGDDLPKVAEAFQVVRETVLGHYKGVWLDPVDAQDAIEALPGFAREFYAMPVGDGAARLDFFNARYVQRTRELRQQFGSPKTLGDYLEVAVSGHPEANRRSEYPFAEVNRATGSVRPKGLQVVSYSPSALWVVREGDLVVSGIDAVHGSIAVAGADVDGMVMSSEMYAYHVKKGSEVSPVYLQLLLRSPAAQELLWGMVTGTSNRTRLERAEQILELPIPPIPSIDEQYAVVRPFTESLVTRRTAFEMQQHAEDAVASTWWPDPA